MAWPIAWTLTLMTIFAAKFEMVPPGIHRSTGSLGDWSYTGMINSTDMDHQQIVAPAAHFRRVPWAGACHRE